MQRKQLQSAQFLQLAFTEKGVKSIKTLEGKLPLTNVAGLRATVCIKHIVSQPFMDLKINAFSLEFMSYDNLKGKE